MNVYEINQFEWKDGYFHLSDSKIIESKKELKEMSYHKNGKLYEVIKLDINEIQRKRESRSRSAKDRIRK